MLDIQGIIRHLKSMGIGILITDHNVRETLKITDRAYIINNGEILRAGTPLELSTDPQVRKSISAKISLCRARSTCEMALEQKLSLRCPRSW